MGRVSRAQAEENRQRVVATASRMFREKGTAVSIADLMKAAGLTHGGFHKQFASKEDLIGEAITHAFEEQAGHSAATAEGKVEEHVGERAVEQEHEHAGEHAAARRTMIEDYLSVWHRDHAGDGCPVSGFATDLGREPEQAADVRHIYRNGVRNRAARVATGDDDGMAQLCTMVGALVLARATRGDALSEELLKAARTALLGSDTGRSEPRPPTD
ncbi:TetR family transcriptional regulator [Streptomyces sp. NPDC051639]|uniref:TetR/AcrR family transcriptional regulator n=1 Tax=unclassified Streptomyces TaxID=2593676 RepID=UPI00341AD261